ncbi:hypothetical protein ACWGIN_31615 [Streptomyces sp. NPDC054861]
MPYGLTARFIRRPGGTGRYTSTTPCPCRRGKRSPPPVAAAPGTTTPPSAAIGPGAAYVAAREDELSWPRVAEDSATEQKARSRILLGGAADPRVRPLGAPSECLVKTLLAWTGEDTLTAGDLEQVLQLTGHVRAVASDVHRRAAQLPKDSGSRALADVVLREVDGTLSAPLEGIARCVRNRARLVQALYTRQ